MQKNTELFKYEVVLACSSCQYVHIKNTGICNLSACGRNQGTRELHSCTLLDVLGIYFVRTLGLLLKG